MKVMGVGAPAWMRIRLGAGELEFVVEELLAQRAQATREVCALYDDPHATPRDVDATHDVLREIEAALMCLEQAEPDSEGRRWLMAATALLEQTVHGAAERAIATLVAEHECFGGHHAESQRNGQGLLDAADLVSEALSTLVAVREIDHGPSDPPYLGTS